MRGVRQDIPRRLLGIVDRLVLPDVIICCLFSFLALDKQTNRWSLFKLIMQSLRRALEGLGMLATLGRKHHQSSLRAKTQHIRKLPCKSL
jgi:hypothetical protein